MPKKTVTKKKKEQIVSKQYKITLAVNDAIYKIEADDLHEAFSVLDIGKIKTRLHFRIEKDEKVCEKLLNAFAGKMILKNKLYRMIFINRLIFK